MAELVRTKVTLTSYRNGQMSLAYDVQAAGRGKGHGKGKIQELLADTFDLPLDSSEVQVRPIRESQLFDLEHVTGTQVQWSSLP